MEIGHIHLRFAKNHPPACLTVCRWKSLKRSLTTRWSMHPRILRPTQLSDEKQGSWLFRIFNSSRVEVQVVVMVLVVLVLRSSNNGTSSWSLQVYETDACWTPCCWGYSSGLWFFERQPEVEHLTNAPTKRTKRRKNSQNRAYIIRSKIHV